MRWKLLVAASLLAAIVGAGGSHVLAYFLLDRTHFLSNQLPAAAAILLLQLLTSFFAGFFVYRHTARRRKLQATITGLASLVLTFATLLIRPLAKVIMG